MLDLFDLDETFSSEKVRLAQLSNKCESLPFVQMLRKSSNTVIVSSLSGC